MKKKTTYYAQFDFLRLLACIGVLFYHLGYLKGGYLAVCLFFVMSGYLASISSFSKEDFSVLAYYKKKFFSLYLPLIVVTFTTVFVSFLIPSIHWLSLKPETTSVLLGYNNYWQLNANLDYFAHHVDSPFMHFWYISILLQLEILFPWLFLGMKKLVNLGKEKLLLLILSIITVCGFGYFAYQSMNQSIMVVYYDTFTRIFSYLFGFLLGTISIFSSKWFPKTIVSKNWYYPIFMIYSVLLCGFFLFLDAESAFFSIGMILVTIISGRLFDYGSVDSSRKKNSFITFFSSFSYEIYLIQYPVIYFFQFLKIHSLIKIPLIILVILFFSYLLHMSLDFKKKKKFYSFVFFGLWIFTSIFGCIQYSISEDHTEEMNELERQLSLNKELMSKRQKEYASRILDEKESMNQSLQEIQQTKENLASYVQNLPIVGIGDSVMLGAVPNLYAKFPNGYFDAQVSRTDWEANRILLGMKYGGYLGDPVVINLGTNGQCGEKCRLEILDTCENRKIYWITVTNDLEVHVNADLWAFAERNPQVSILDWASYSNGHSEYFIADGIHLTDVGRDAYTNFIYQSIYDSYYNQYSLQEEAILQQYEEELNQKILFYGNDLLLNSHEKIKNQFDENIPVFEMISTYEDVLRDLKEKEKSNTLPRRIVFLYDASFSFTSEQFQELTSTFTNHDFYLITLNQTVTIPGVHSYAFEVKDSYWSVDRVHLSEEGNEELIHFLSQILS